MLSATAKNIVFIKEFLCFNYNAVVCPLSSIARRKIPAKAGLFLKDEL